MKRRTAAGIAFLTLFSTAAVKAQSTEIYHYNVTSYSANGNVISYDDKINGVWEFGYDGLNRLKSGTLNREAQATQYYCWAYDSFGNRKVQQISDQPFTASSGTSCQASGTLLSNVFTTPDSSNPTRIQSMNAGSPNIPLPSGITSTPIYDAAGNMTYDGRNSIAYDVEGRICAVLANGTLTQYLYDAEGRRVAKGHSASSTTLGCAQSGDFVADTKYIVGQSGEQVTELNSSDQWQHSNVWANGQLLATYDTQGLHFNVTDQLGTKRVQTSATGVPELRYASLPYGDGATTDAAGIDATEHRFTGKERDSESGNDYFGARYYSSNMGRFMSPDPSGLAYAILENPQSFNLYSYVMNNPLKFTDPSGMACVWDDGSFDSEDDKQTGSAGSCKDAGGTWLDRGATASLSGGQDWSNQADSYIADAANFSSANVNAGPWDFATFKSYGSMWAAGTLQTQINYGPNDPATLAMINRPYVQAQLASYAQAGCPASGPTTNIGQDSFDAYAESRADVGSGKPNYVQIEVGGYSGNISTSGGTTTVTLSNVSGISSLSGYSAGVGKANQKLGTHFNRNALDRTSGHGRNVTQTFTQTMASPCGHQ